MPFHGSSDFEAYARTLRRVFWSEFLDRQSGLAPFNNTNADTGHKSDPAIAVYPLPGTRNSPQR